MADPFQLRRIVLILFKKIIKVLSLTLGSAIIALAALGTVAWNRPDLIVQAVRHLLPEGIRSSFSVEKITGNPRVGYQLKNFFLRLPNRTLLIDSLEFNIAWLPLVHRRTHIEYFNAHVKGSTVTAQGNVHFYPLAVDLSLTSAGLVDGVFSVQGSTGHWEVKAQGNYESPKGPYSGNLMANGSGIDPATLKAEGQIQLQFRHAPLVNIDAQIDQTEFSADLDVSNLRISTPAIDRAHLSVHGSTSSHQFHLTVRSNDETLEARGSGKLNGKVWMAEWTDFRVHSYGDWRNVGPFKTVFNPPSYQLHNLNLTNGTARLHFHGNLINRKWDPLSIKLNNFNLSHLNEFGFVSVPLKGNVTGKTVLKGPLQQPTGQISLEIKGAEVDNRNIGDITGKAELSPKLLRVDHLRIKSDQGTLFLTGLIPLEKGQPRFSNFDLTLKAMDYNPSEILQTFTHSTLRGALLNADLTIKRTEGTFSTQGVLQLQAEQYIPIEQGPELKQIILILRGAGESLQIEKGAAQSGKNGNVSVSGTIDRNGPRTTFIADRLTFQWPAGISGELDARISFTGTWAEPVLKGVVDIKRADYNPDKNVDKKKPEKNNPAQEGGNAPSPLAMKIKITFDRDVWYKNKQTSIEFKGNLDIRKSSGEETRVFGRIEVIRGAYVAYGRVFDVEEGSLVFSGSTPADPLLSIRALYLDKVSKIRVYLVLTGSMRHPRLTLTSEPPLDEADIISVLATGKPLYQLGEGEGVASQQIAQNMVASYLAEGVRQQLQSIIGLDVFRVQIKNQESTDVVAGKNISRDLFISYGQTLGPSGEQRIEAEYTLTKRWSLEGRTTSLGRYVIDLLFKFGFK